MKSAPVLATDRFVNGNSDPKWSRDGQYLAYRRDSAIVIRAAKTGAERVVTTELRAAQLIAWFPDGRSVLVLSHDPEQRRTAFHRLDTTSGNADQLLSVNEREGRLNGRADLSRDGRWVFHFDESQEPGKLMRFDIDSRRDVEVMSGPVGSFAISPDGLQLAFFESGWLKLMPVGGGEPRKVLAAGGGGGLAWTPDQRYLMFVSGRDDAGQPGAWKLWRIRVAGGEREDTGLSGGVQSLTLHPGGHQITYRRSDRRPFELWALENFLPKPGASK